MPRKPSTSPFQITIASRLGPQGYGGLAAYQRGLANALAECHPDIVTRFVHSAATPEPPPFATASTRAHLSLRGRLLSAAWPNLANRPALHGTLESMLENAWSTPRDCWPRGSGTIHFVGTGWDYFGYYTLAVARRLGLKFTVWPATHPSVWGDDRIDLRLYRQADGVFCQSQTEASHLIKLGVQPDQVVITGLPPMCNSDGDESGFRARYNLRSRPIVLYLGRLDEGKGCPSVVRAWKHVLRAHPEAALVIAGPGDRPPALAALPETSFVFLGEIDESTKADALAACDIFCLPSREESFGIVYIEAWSYSKPVICGPAPATREWVRHGVNGIHSTQDPMTLSNDIITLLSDPKKCRDIGEAGHRLQAHRLTWPRVVETHLRAFDDDPEAVREAVG